MAGPCPRHQHPLAKKTAVTLAELKPFFFVTLTDIRHPGTRAWLTNLCQEAGFNPRILQDVDLESGIMNFVAEGLGVSLAREQIKKLPHPGVVFRPLATQSKADQWIAWHPGNKSKALAQYIEVIKKEALSWR